MGLVKSRNVVVGLWLVTLVLLEFLVSCNNTSQDDNKNLCLNVTCGNGNCYMQGGEAFCLCDDGYQADGLSCVKDACDPDPCVYGLCKVSNGKPLCDCDTGYTGEFCNQCEAGYVPRENLCVPGDPSADPCLNDPCVFGVCSVVDSLLTCTCHAGYDGKLCDACKDGYHPEELGCKPNSVCSPNPCLHGTCRDDNGNSACECSEGYAGDTCSECDEGFEPDGIACVPVAPKDPCDPNPCLALPDQNRTQCVNVGGEAVCGCDNNYQLDEEQDLCVELTDPCDPNPCLDLVDQHRNVCSPNGQDYQCFCEEGFTEGNGGDCEEDTTSIPTRDAFVKIQYQSSSAGPVYVRGEFNGWGKSHPMVKTGQIWEIEFADLAIGDYAYKLYDESNDSWFIDPNNRYTKYASTSESSPNSRLRFPDFNKPLLVLDAEPVADNGSIKFSVATYYGKGRFPLDASTAKVYRNGELDNSVTFSEQTGVFTVNATGLANNKYSYTFEISDTNGNVANSLFVPVWLEDKAFDWRDASMYFILTDRFANGDNSNDSPVNHSGLDWKANWQGGDFAGIVEKLNDGYFESLGVNTLWISSPIMNTQDAFWGSDGHMYSGYHSYWPIATGWTNDNNLAGVQPVDPHFGDLDDFKELVQLAHEKGMRVMMDFVANHVHSDSPLYQQHWQDAEPWFHWNNGNQGEGYVCGWEQPISCWFAEYLPDFEYKNMDVVKVVMDHAMWVIKETNIDGFRMDAVKHMILDFSSTLRARLDDEIDTTDAIRFYMVGETFTGENGHEELAPYVDTTLLDGQFDFPVFWKALKTLVKGESDLYELKNFMDFNDNYYGSEAIMSNFIGNHDVERALSHAAGQIYGDPKAQGWNNPPGVPDYESPFKKLRLAWTFLFTQVGIPLIYYADEYGMPGAGDPDNRRFMQFGNDLSQYQKDTLAHVKKLGLMRLDERALRRGDRHTVVIESDYWAYVMKDGNESVLVVINRGTSTSKSLSIGSHGFSNGETLSDVLSNKSVTVSGGNVTVQLGELESAVFVRNGK